MEPKGKIGVYLSNKKNKSSKYEILQLLEKKLDTSDPEKGEIPIKLLGFGEISIVFEILEEKVKGLAFKRLPIFESKEQVEKHIKAYDEYHRILNEVIGMKVPSSDTAWVYCDEKMKKISLYCIQDKLNPDAVGNKIIHNVNEDKIKTLIILILQEMKKVWLHNKNTPEEGLQIGLDGQISNWVVEGYNPEKQLINRDSELIYLDTSTPMYRIDGEDAMEGKLFLQSAPSFMRWALKPLLKEVLDRYYDWREVIIDLIANFYKEQLPELIPDVINWVNGFLENEAKEFEIEPLTQEEIEKYYKHDKFIWVLFQNLRKFDRFIKTKILRKKYDFYLPSKIKR